MFVFHWSITELIFVCMLALFVVLCLIAWTVELAIIKGKKLFRRKPRANGGNG